MAIVVAVSNNRTRKDLDGTIRRAATLTITGLTAGQANTIPHTLPYKPTRCSLIPGANGLWGETQVPDGTNLYVTVGGGGSTSGRADVEE